MTQASVTAETGILVNCAVFCDFDIFDLLQVIVI